LTERRPEEADFGIQVDIDFVDVENLDGRLVSRQPSLNRASALRRRGTRELQRWPSTTPA